MTEPSSCDGPGCQASGRMWVVNGWVFRTSIEYLTTRCSVSALPRANLEKNVIIEAFHARERTWSMPVSAQPSWCHHHVDESTTPWAAQQAEMVSVPKINANVDLRGVYTVLEHMPFRTYRRSCMRLLMEKRRCLWGATWQGLDATAAARNQEPVTETPVRGSTNRADQWHVIELPSELHGI